MKGQICADCGHSKLLPGPDRAMKLFCTRYPRQVVMVITPEGTSLQSVYPQTTKDDGCGEWSQKPLVERMKLT